jgi:DNA-binding transcriptional MerR regulator
MTVEIDAVQQVYGITAAAAVVGVGEQTLRLYERRGLITPARTAGGTRRYSEGDILLLRRIALLLQGGVNLAGARQILELEAVVGEMRLLVAELSAAVVTESEGNAS